MDVKLVCQPVGVEEERTASKEDQSYVVNSTYLSKGFFKLPTRV